MGVGYFSSLIPRCFRWCSSHFLSQQPKLILPTFKESDVAYRARCASCKIYFRKLLYRDNSFRCDRCYLRLSNTEDSMSSTSSSFPAMSSSEYYSPRIRRMIMERMNNPGMDIVESEVEASRVTWSELSPSVDVGDETAADNLKVFKSLQRQWPGRFFQDWQEGEWEVGKKLAEGGQAEIFQVKRSKILMDRGWVIKMFKEGLCLQDLQRLLPHGMLGDEYTRECGHFSGGSYCNSIHGAMLYNGRFAFWMERKWGDLRKLIDARMIYNYYRQYAPFSEIDAGFCMLEIATGMQELHRSNITHGDLKAANVLVWAYDKQILSEHILDPIHGRFSCAVADFECSVGVVGTGFWRAPEILLGVKNRNVTPKLFTQASDVYSYGMTCYEILTGLIPFELEDFLPNEYDRVIGGYRPSLPSKTPGWMKALLSKCWHKSPSNRPTFEEIVHTIRANVMF